MTSFPIITAEELRGRLYSRQNILILDTNEKEYYDNGHIPGAKHLPYQGMVMELRKMNIPKNMEVITYCKNSMCTACHIAAEKLKILGYTNIKILVEGTDGWAKAGFRLEK
ncbi:MAG: rhodanese-like domain-containing protein [Candidatus Diapherotrites archaeon]|uniref:Rhodanese-like domain-containing protein n=1 Tax=Candidatus Iainarchaeum sp. TaxID=3101447 RepID=A0A7J4IXV3_9ARCH|nr:MAG: Rhodanese protein [archaeon GW2011_AR10]MBS3059778.1 rhodanese-like domain-containing protein [Candidatus Diapherotrites archaeon]HIH07796.1 rhodanese-like domain-containing protein [Candidatus Diapherotrites archaeon]